MGCSALLGQYTTLSNFNGYFQPLDYTEAEKRVSTSPLAHDSRMTRAIVRKVIH